MIYNINGLSVEIPLKLYLEMDDEEFSREVEDLLISNFGRDINDPFYNSCTGVEIQTLENIEDLDLTEILPVDKLLDLDTEPTEE